MRRIRLMTMTFIPESVRFVSESFSVVFAVIMAVLAAIVMTGFWEFLFQEIKLKRHEQKCRRMTATSQNNESDNDEQGAVYSGRPCKWRRRAASIRFRDEAEKRSVLRGGLS